MILVVKKEEKKVKLAMDGNLRNFSFFIYKYMLICCSKACEKILVISQLIHLTL